MEPCRCVYILYTVNLKEEKELPSSSASSSQEIFKSKVLFLIEGVVFERVKNNTTHKHIYPSLYIQTKLEGKYNQNFF